MTEEMRPEPSGRPDAGWHALHLPWPSAPTASSGTVPRVRWRRTGNRLRWEIESPAPLAARPAFPASGFVEGLWEQDLAECFLLDIPSGHYTEYNLSPGGAWWAAHFIAPRVRCDPQPTPDAFGVELGTTWSDQGWSGWMEIPLPPSDHFAFNLTAIVQTTQGCCYYSLAGLGGSRPDYHRPEDWLKWV